MLHAFVYNEVAVLVRHWFEIGRRDSRMEHGARIEVRLRAPQPRRGTYAAAQVIAVDRPLWRADLFDRVDGVPGGFEAAHFHPSFIGVEPCDRTWADEVQKTPWDWLHSRLSDVPGIVAHNPRSNMNNSVGYARPARFHNPVVLGTDGIGADMLEEFRLAYARLREDDVLATPEDAWRWVESGYRLVPEAADDQVTWSYDHADSPWHLAFTPGVRPVDVVVDGDVVLKDGQATRVDAHEVRARAAEQAARLFQRL